AFTLEKALRAAKLGSGYVICTYPFLLRLRSLSAPLFYGRMIVRQPDYGVILGRAIPHSEAQTGHPDQCSFQRERRLPSKSPNTSKIRSFMARCIPANGSSKAAWPNSSTSATAAFARHCY